MSHAHAYSETAEATVMLDIGEGFGALVLHAPPSLAGAEIDLARRGETRPFVHTAVRPRRVRGDVRFAGIYPQLPVGEYTVLDAAGRPRGNVTVHSGRVTEAEWERL